MFHLTVCRRNQTRNGSSASLPVPLPGILVCFCRMATILLLGLACMGASGGTAGAQTAYVPGGLIMHPTAFTPRRNSIFFYGAAFTQNENVTESHYPVTLSYSPTDNLQVSFLTAYHQAATKPTHTHLGGFVKYQLLPDLPRILRSPLLFLMSRVTSWKRRRSASSATGSLTEDTRCWRCILAQSGSELLLPQEISRMPPVS